MHWPGNAPRPDAILGRHPGQFSALLEDPSGAGRQFLVSRGGRVHTLKHGERHQSGEFISHWRRIAHGRSTHEDAGHAVQALFYAGYEAGGLIESLPAASSAIDGPLLWLHEPDWSCCFDAGSESVYISCRRETQLDAVESMLLSTQREEMRRSGLDGDISVVGDTAAYQSAVHTTKAYIAAGDIFQANIARFWSISCEAESALPLYQRLRRVNPAPFSAYVDIGKGEDRLQIISASPERLFRISGDGRVDTRPIAGTRRRGEGDQDDALKAEMLLSEKERAEHIMLVDLERNDLGRVCRPGSIEVNERMAVEQYATVQHIVSNVRGRLKEGMDVVDVFQAMFPGGTITGCPKLRCMEIIHELEPCSRGPYTGGIGYMAWDGSADMNILIRTLWQHRGRLHWAAGAGIVADSDAEAELLETEHKAAGLLRALRSGTTSS
ncbi:MAG: anthranilate synthase component I family protein [Mariprofundaceae bacterium]